MFMRQTMSLATLEKVSLQRRPGYKDRCLELGKLRGGKLYFSAAAWKTIRSEFSPPSAIALAGNAMAAGNRLLEKIIQNEPIQKQKDEIAKRLAICGECDFYVAPSMRCSHPKCGCFLRFKTRLTSEHCPLDPPKW